VAELLISAGHRFLAMVSGRFASSDRAVARRDGFVAAALDARLDAPRIVEVDFLAADLAQAVEPMFRDRAKAPSAIFCSNDLLAISVLGALGRLGLSVPDEVAVIGFDGIAVGTHMHPSLASVVQPSFEMGRTAAKVLLDRLRGSTHSAETHVLPHLFRWGETAGPAGKPSPAAPATVTHHR
jgi:DNA-binding LacI/PurR family transcriptional regulator